MKFKRIDARELNFVDSACREEYKLDTSGTGEKRLYVGHDEAELDEFFELDKIESFIFLKKDLQKYLVDAKEEYFTPVQSYKNDISKYYDENVLNTDAINDEVIYLNFTKKYDSQHRYYLNFRKDGYSRERYNYFLNIALPRATRLSFLKIESLKDGKLYIYIKPTFYIDDREKIEKTIDFHD